jgi:hypothetical protein
MKNKQSQPLTSVLQKWGICTKFEHWNSIKLDYYNEHSTSNSPPSQSPKTLHASQTHQIINL